MSGEDGSSGWQLTESDPGVFTYASLLLFYSTAFQFSFQSELLKSLGVPLIVDDLYSLDPDSLASLQVRSSLFHLIHSAIVFSAPPCPHLPIQMGAFSHQQRALRLFWSTRS
jgi:ubiquitin carboxyl-terminal hydrolase L5